MSEITEGCICCVMKSDVSQQLHELYLKYQPDIIFIECSGVAEPLAVVDACFTPVLAPFITLRVWWELLMQACIHELNLIHKTLQLYFMNNFVIVRLYLLIK